MDVINFTGAGLRDAKVKKSDGTEIDIYAVVTAEGDPERDEVEVKGDDELIAIYNFGLREKITLKGNGLSFDTIAAITGNDVSSSATGSEIGLGTDSEKNPPYVEIQAFSTAKSADGTACEIKKVWHKVQITNIKVSQSGENEFSMEAEGMAYQTDEDIEGSSLSEAKISTLYIYSAA